MNNKKDKVKNQRYFQEDWLNDPAFKDWLRKDSKNKAKARCVVCHETFELSFSGRSAITDHGKGNKHLEELRKVNSFFSPQKKKDESISASQISALETPELSSATAGQQTLDSCIYISDVVRAEIIWTMKIIDCGFSLRSSGNQSDLCSTMFPDSAIARGFQMDKTKTMYEITHELAFYFKSILVDAVG